MTDVTITGLPSLKNEFKAVPLKLQRRVLNKAIKAGAKIISAQVKANVKSSAYRTGAIFRNVVEQRGKRKFDKGLTARYVIGVRHGKVREQPSTFKTKSGKTRTRKLTAYDKRKEDPFYYRFQELGWRAGNTEVPGKEFLQKGLEASARAAIDKTISTAKQLLAQGALSK